MTQTSPYLYRRVRVARGAFVALAGASLLISTLVAGTAPGAGKKAHAAPDSQPFTEQKVTATDGTSNSFFGSAAAIQGKTALIGADGEDSFTGAAYFFSNVAGTWVQGQKLTPSDGQSGDEFGYRVALGQDTLVVTAFSATVNGLVAQGAAYVFTRQGSTWVETQKLTASDGGLFDNFGASVALQGSTLVIGANGATVGENAAQGAVYVFTNTGGVWTQTQKLTADDGEAFDNFGLSVALRDSIVLVGSPRATVNGSAAQGAAYVYAGSGGTYTQVQRIVASDGAPNDGFGESVGLNRDVAIIGAYNATVNGNPGQGAAYVFNGTTGSYLQMQKITASDGTAGANFGNALAVHGTTTLIGADVSTVGNNTSQGKAYLFSMLGGVFTQVKVLTASDGMTDDFFGAALALDDSTALVASPHPTINGNTYQGAAYFYRKIKE